MKIKANRNTFSNPTIAKTYFREVKGWNEDQMIFFNTWSSREINLSVEEILNPEKALINNIYLLTNVFNSENISELMESDRNTKIKILLILLKNIYSLTKTEARSNLSLLINWMKNENITFTEEEINELLDTDGYPSKLNTIFNGRKTYMKVFIDAFGSTKVFSINTENMFVFNREYAIAKGICPNCGNKLLFIEDNHFDHRNNRRLFCSFTGCINSYMSTHDLSAEGLEAMQPVFDKNCLFSEETLVQMKISFKFNRYRPNTFNILKEILYIFTHSYNKGALENAENYVYTFYTQPLGIKTAKKLVEKLMNSSFIDTDEEVKNVKDFCSIEHSIVRLFNISNIEEIYEEALNKELILFTSGASIIFDLTNMTVTAVSEEKTINDAFVATEEGYKFVAKDAGLLEILKEEK